ncbi:HEPN domain-containing protein [Bacillus sp. JZ8]
MRYRFIAVIHNLQLENKKNKGTRVFHARLSNGPRILEETIHTNLMQGTLGVHSQREFNGSTYIYIDNKLGEVKTREEMDQLGTSIAFIHLRQIQHFIKQLWKIKDNSAYVRDGFVLAYPDNGTFEDGCTYKASVSEIYTFSNCEIKPCSFSEEEISRASQLYENSPDVINDKYYDPEQEWGKLPSANHLIEGKEESSRIIRASYFTEGARRNGILPTKIISYCNALECLFTTGSNRVSHNIAERLGLLLSKDETEKQLYYDIVREAYKYRSLIVHGQTLKEEHKEKLIVVSHNLDSFLRRIFLDNHEIFSKSDKEIDSFFNQGVLT